MTVKFQGIRFKVNIVAVSSVLLGALSSCGDGADVSENSPLHWGAVSSHLEGSKGLVLPGIPISLFRSHLAKGNGVVPFLWDGARGRGAQQFGLSASEGVEGLFGKQLPHADLRWETLESSSYSGTLQPVRRQLYFRGIPIEESEVKAHEIASIPGHLWASGSLPGWFQLSQSEISVNDFTLNEQEARDKAADELSFHPFRFRQAKKIFLSGEKGPSAAYSYVVSSAPWDEGDGPAVPLKVIVDGQTGQVLLQQPLAFHATGKAHIFEENSVASIEGAKDITLPDLENDGSKLSNRLFRVLNCESREPSSSCREIAVGKAGDFREYEFDSISYDEVMGYHSIAKALTWHRKIMGMLGDTAGKNFGEDKADFGLNGKRGPLKVYVRAQTKLPTNDFTLDNAQYLPTGLDGLGTPEIIIGTGWEPSQGSTKRFLVYLGKDADVAMHEFGHHMVFRSIRNITGQSGAMHEGFADFFAYATTGNNKLGESIVRTGLPLREGTLQGSVVNYLNTPAHRAGQFWSSALWDVRVSLGTWKEGVFKGDKIIWDSIDLLKDNAQYYDAISAIGQSAEAFAQLTGDNGKDLKNKIFAVFANRGFIEAPNESGNLPIAKKEIMSGSTSSSASGGGGTASSGTKKRSSSSWCGVIAGQHQETSSSNAWLLILCLGLPLGMAAFTRRTQG